MTDEDEKPEALAQLTPDGFALAMYKAAESGWYVLYDAGDGEWRPIRGPFDSEWKAAFVRDALVNEYPDIKLNLESIRDPR